MAVSARSATAAWQPAGAHTRPFRFGADHVPDVDPALQPGETVAGAYQIVRLLGEGGMGRVYEALEIATRRKIALKVLRRDRNRPEDFARFRLEAEAATRVGHASIVAVYAFETTDEGRALMAMELLAGESLESWMARPGDLHAGLWFLVAIAEGLDAAHRAGVVHRDIKPANLFLHRDAAGIMRPKILDFGIAKVTTTAHTNIATQAGTLLGTPYYLAPERALGRPLDARSDIYSLGVILYELMTGTLPFLADTFMGILVKHAHVDPLDPRQAAPDRAIPDELAALAMSMLAKDADRRSQTAGGVAERLSALATAFEPALVRFETGPRALAEPHAPTIAVDVVAERATALPGDARGERAGGRAAATAAAPELAVRSAGVRTRVGSPGGGHTARATRRRRPWWLIGVVVTAALVGVAGARMVAGGPDGGTVRAARQGLAPIAPRTSSGRTPGAWSSPRPKVDDRTERAAAGLGAALEPASATRPPQSETRGRRQPRPPSSPRAKSPPSPVEPIALPAQPEPQAFPPTPAPTTPSVFKPIPELED